MAQPPLSLGERIISTHVGNLARALAFQYSVLCGSTDVYYMTKFSGINRLARNLWTSPISIYFFLPNQAP